MNPRDGRKVGEIGETRRNGFAFRSVTVVFDGYTSIGSLHGDPQDVWSSVCKVALVLRWRGRVGGPVFYSGFGDTTRTVGSPGSTAGGDSGACRSERFNYVPRIRSHAETSTHGFVV